VPALLRAALEEGGLSPDAIDVAPTEADALRWALSLARPGDIVVVLAHLETQEVQTVLAESRSGEGEAAETLTRVK